METPLTVVVVAKNESERIADCLASVFGWAKEIIVVDDESIDSTRDIARSYTDKIFVRRMDIEGGHRNWAYAQASQVWVLSLDADERLTTELQEEITATLRAQPCAAAFTIPRKNYLGDY